MSAIHKFGHRTWALLVIAACWSGMAHAQLSAQTNQPVRLALIVESSEAATVGDVLTAELSKNGQIHLLERTEIEKVYREQGLSAGNKDYLKLGQILGADGLWLFAINRTPQQTNLTARLIAVKPGVVLVEESFPWPLPNVTEWTPLIANRLTPFLPKLTVLVKDAIPISVVNLRSAIQSGESLETERQLKLLTIQRLSRERQLFVLERQRLQLLSEEKSLKGMDDSAFWNGSYLLEGVVDQNGYSKETITINARLTPPKGGTPLLMEVSGSRTNFVEVINQLATKVIEALKIASTVKEWNAADEAQQYFDEAKWAFRWGVLPEAQAAADSAWALGKKDLDCALVRVKAYVAEVSVNNVVYNTSEHYFSPGYDANGAIISPRPDDSYVQSDIKEMQSQHPSGMAYSLQEIGEAKNIHYVFADRTPDPKGIDRAMYALELYYEFCRTSSDGNPEVNSRWENEGWYNSAWYNLGIEDLVAASRVLQDFHFFPEAQKPVTEKLAELRALARSVAELISKSPSVHDSYFVGDRIATHDKLHVTIADAPNIIACKVAWGGFWQEKPEDAVALYREQMSSPVFCYIHSGFWFRELQSPRLVAWNKSDQRRIPVVWDNFIRALNDSTNILLRAEAKAVRLVDARNDKELTVSFNDFFDTIFANRGAFVTNNVELLYLNWGIDGLISKMGGEDVVSRVKEALQNRFYSEYRPKLDAMDREYWDKTIPARKMLAAFEAQKQYLKENKPYDFIEFIHIFENRNYSKAQALEIQPLLAAYKSNLVAQADGQSGVSKYKTLDGVHQVGFFLENGVNRILNPPAPQPANAVVQNRSPVVAAKPKAVPAIPKVLAENATNILLVKNYLKVPRDRFTATNINNFGISANRWSNGKLLLDLRYRGDIYSGDYKVASGALFVAAAIFDPSNGSWIIMEYPGDYFRDPTLGLINQNKSGLCFELFQDDFYSSAGGPLNKFDSKTRKWEILNIPGQNNSQLFGIDEVFYAANGENIIEIINGGKGTHILASTRRRPAVSTLDSLGGLGSPILFSGLNHSLCASVGNKIYNWDGNDWRELFALNILRRPEIFEEAVVFRSAPTFNSDDRANLWLWKKDQAQPELSLSDNPKPHPGIVNNSIHKPDSLPSRALWKSPMGDYLVSSAAVYFKSNLYFFVDHANIVNQSGQWTVTEKDGCHARLVCLSRDLPEPVVVPLKFNLQQGRPPLKSLGEKFEQVPWLAGDTWMQFAGDALYIGQPDTPGIWVVPISEIEAAVSAQKQFLLDKIAQATAAAKQVKEELLAKYDHNHNGVIDREEKEEALDDPVFIESELAAIDANHNGCLDAVELVYFDANGNKILDAKEQAGIEVAEDLLAAKFMKEFDADGDGVFNRSEFDAAWRSGLEADLAFVPGFSWPDQNHDGQVDLGEFESFLKGQTLRGLYPRGMPGAAFVGQMRPGDSKRIGPQERFKISVEAYWQNPGSINNRPPLTGNAITNGTQSGKIQ